MKKFTIILSLLFISVFVNAQVLISEGFEGTFPPTGWTIVNGGLGASAHNWSYNTDPVFTDGPYAAHAGNKAMVYEYDATAWADSWAFSPDVSLTAGVSYSISFWYKVQNATYPEKMAVTIGNGATIAAQTTILWNNNGVSQLTNTTYALTTIQYTPTISGIFNVAFNCYSDADKWAMCIDDVTIQVTPGAVGCTTNLLPVNNATNVTINNILFSWDSVPGATQYNLYLDNNSAPTTFITTITDTSIVLNGASPNTTYYWRVVAENAAGPDTSCTNVSSFTTGAGAVNDSICNAITLFMDGPSDCKNTAMATTSSEDAILTCSTPNNTVWYKYKPTVTGMVQIKMKRTGSTGTPLDAWVAGFTATGTCPTLTPNTLKFGCSRANLTTADSVMILTSSLIAGTTYYIMIDGYNGAMGEFCISIVPPPPPPANDRICNATELFLNGPADCQNNTYATTTFEDFNLTCNTPKRTVWYKYTPTVNGAVQIKMKRSGSSLANQLDAQVAGFTAINNCPSLVANTQILNCNFIDLTTIDSGYITTSSLTAGTTYYFVVDGYLSSIGEFCISLITPIIPPPCANIISPANAAQNVNAPSNTFIWNSVSGATGYNFFLGTNPSPAFVALVTDTTYTVPDLLYGATNYWSVVPTNQGIDATGCGIYSFKTKFAPPPPVNDSCGKAIPLTPFVAVSGSTISATQSTPAVSCNGSTGTADDDVWYYFTPTTTGNYALTLTPDGSFDGVIVYYSGYISGGFCGSVVYENCIDATTNGGTEILTMNGLKADTTYLIRVYSFGSLTGASGTFTLNLTSTILPISLTTFTVKKEGGINRLLWTTLTEQNNNGFEVQRSIDGHHFSGIGFVHSVAFGGNSSTKNDYSFADKTINKSGTYYRLQQMDKDGKTILSNVVFINGIKLTALTLSGVYPNPAADKVNIVISSPSVNNIKLVVTDMAGKSLMTQAVNILAGDQVQYLNIEGLAKGNYLLKAVCNNGCETSVLKFVKN